MILLIPLGVFASAIEDPDYEVKQVYINATLDFLGSLRIQEAIVVDGALNGFERKIDYKNSNLQDWEEGEIDFANSSIYNARGIDIQQISAKKITKDEIGWDLFKDEFTSYVEDSSASKGEEGKYTLAENENGVDIKTYSPNEDGYIVYFFDYFVNQVAVLHEDIAELYYTMFVLDENVDAIDIQLTIPGKCTNETFRYWAHGPLNGSISGISEEKDEDGNDLYRGIYIHLEDYEASEPIEVRMLFDKNIVSIGEAFLNKSGVQAFDGVIEVETERANESNAQRRFIKILFWGSMILGIAYIIGVLILWLYIYFKYDREYKSSFNLYYYREFTGDYEVEVVDYLMKKDITPAAMNASIMNLIYKGAIEIAEIPSQKKKDKDVKLIKKSEEHVNDTEKKLLSLLFDTVGNGQEVTLKEIEKFSKNYNTAEKFMLGYNSWQMSAKADAKKEGFFEDHNGIRAIATAYMFLGILLIIFMAILKIENIVLIIAIAISSVALLIYALSFKKWSVKGREHYLKWTAFKRFLTDFGKLQEKEVPDIKLWDKYLVYATLFGIAKEVQKAMQVRLTAMGETNMVYYPTSLYYRDLYIVDRISRSMSQAHTQSVAAINAHNANSSSSSGSGFGGGFSGGGGFAGGGGGGGGF